MLETESKPKRTNMPNSPDKPQYSKVEIPKDILKKFLAGKITIPANSRISKTEAEHLWSVNETHRFRINVWIEENREGCFCNRNYIGYSWFVHYTKKKIIDKTIAPKIIAKI